MKSLKEFIKESQNNSELIKLLTPYNNNDVNYDFNGINVDLANYLEKNYKSNKIKDSKLLKNGDAFVKYTKENEYGGIYSITFGFVDNNEFKMVNFHMPNNKAIAKPFNTKNLYIDNDDNCYRLDSSLLSGVKKLIK